MPINSSKQPERFGRGPIGSGVGRTRLGFAAARGSTGQACKDVNRDSSIVVSRAGSKKAEEMLGRKRAEQKHHKRLFYGHRLQNQNSKQQQPV